MIAIDVVEAMGDLERMVAAVKGQGGEESRFAKVLATLEALARKEGIPLAIVGGLAAIHHGYERVHQRHRHRGPEPESGHSDEGCPHYGIKVIWKDPDGWHKLPCEGVPVDVVPEGRQQDPSHDRYNPQRFGSSLSAPQAARSR